MDQTQKTIQFFSGGAGSSQRRGVFLIATCALSLLCVFDFVLMPKPIMTIRKNDYVLGKRQSFGFFDDISTKDWELVRKRVRERKNHNDKILGQRSKVVWMDVPNAWYQNNWEPDFTCKHELRVGGLGDGPKWVCDPHRIARSSTERKKKGGNGCLIYSMGTYGNLRFERSIQNLIHEGSNSYCEIHLFDAEMGYDHTVLPEGMIHHKWGLEPSSNNSPKRNYMTFQETVEALGHRNRVIDILKVDCEKCEWETYKDWFDAPVTFNQLLVEVHNSPPQANDFFETLQRNNYVTYHKEANTHFSAGRCQEYAFLKLAPEFFH